MVSIMFELTERENIKLEILSSFYDVSKTTVIRALIREEYSELDELEWI